MEVEFGGLGLPPPLTGSAFLSHSLIFSFFSFLGWFEFGRGVTSQTQTHRWHPQIMADELVSGE